MTGSDGAPPRALRVAVLVATSAIAAVLLFATPALIQPWPADAPWFESPGLFPRAALSLVLLAGLAASLGGAAPPADAGDDLDASTSRPQIALAVLLAFAALPLAMRWLGYGLATVLFVTVAARLSGLRWRDSLLLAAASGVIGWLVFERLLAVPFGRSAWFG